MAKVKNKISKFIGKQISRQNRMKDYALIILNLINMLSLLKLAFDFPSEFIFILLPFTYLLFLLCGYLFDKANIFSEDARQTIDINYRRYNLENLKQHEFQLMQTKYTLHALSKLSNDPLIILEITSLILDLETDFKEYKKRWGYLS